MDAKEKAGYMPEEESLGLSLLEKGQQGLAPVVFSRLGIIVLLLLLQLLLLFTAFYWLNAYLPHFIIVSTLFSGFMSMYLLNTDMDATAKITWLLVIMLLDNALQPEACILTTAVLGLSGVAVYSLFLLCTRDELFMWGIGKAREKILQRFG